ncbi:FecCD family ABC transporter permease [Vagococcus intermedius]|uniref:FecCD family ABC transporter permease n=1 Tax=Vagococcus intermedius TaxID=2991418 RepID=UPI0023B7A643|nr:iron ABC transporter permease [Vagococcus intermedius]WEG75100.1 iron ABC transporter permease [Vagococcus intermedius]
MSAIYSVTLGSVGIDWRDVYQIIWHKLSGTSDLSGNVDVSHIDIVWLIRLPRVILAMLVGASLALAGTVMQALVKNPLADPYILGISSGASLGATLAIMLGVGTTFGSNFVGMSAFIGALISSFLVLFIGNIGRRTDIAQLLLVGVAISAICSAASSFIVFMSKNREGMQTLNFWLMGSLSGANWENIKLLFPLVTLAMVLFIIQARILNLMVVGDETASNLGRNLQLYRILYIVIVALLIGFVVYSCGIIGFVGLVIPHIARLLVGANHRKMLPVSLLVGALFLLWSDVLARLIIPGSEIPIGIIVSSVGGPFFLYLVIQNALRRRG